MHTVHPSTHPSLQDNPVPSHQNCLQDSSNNTRNRRKNTTRVHGEISSAVGLDGRRGASARGGVPGLLAGGTGRGSVGLLSLAGASEGGLGGAGGGGGLGGGGGELAGVAAEDGLLAGVVVCFWGVMLVFWVLDLVLKVWVNLRRRGSLGQLLKQVSMLPKALQRQT